MLATGQDDASARLRHRALALFCEVGFGNTNVDDIARAAGVGVATLYRRWPDKAALANELYREAAEGIASLLDAPLSGSDRKRFLELWHRVWTWACAHPDEFMFVETSLNAAFLSEENRRLKAESDLAAAEVIADLNLTADLATVNAMILGTVAMLLRKEAQHDVDVGELGSRLWKALK